jgi:transposase
MLAITPEQLVPDNHPIRRIKPIVDAALAELSPRFEEAYARIGRPSVPPEHLLKAQLLMALFSVPSARRFCDQLQYNMLFKWFLDLNIDDRPFDASTFSKNQERLLTHDVARRFLLQVIAQARQRHLLSQEHFTVDGTLLDAWASLKSVRPKHDGQPPAARGKNPDVDYKGQRRTNDTHASSTDPEAKLARKSYGETTKLRYAGHVVMENRNGLVVDVSVTQTVGMTEWAAALTMLSALPDGARTVGADKGYDNKAFIAGCRDLGITPHVAQWPTTRRRWSAIDGRTTRHDGYSLSQRVRKRVEEIFGWWKTVAGGRKLRFIGVARNMLYAEIVMSAYNLVRMANIERQAGVA